MHISQLRLLSIILLEGFVVLAAEVLAIRQLMPYAGSGIEVVSIIITAVLLPMAYGYAVGGRYKAVDGASTMAYLRRNFLIALIILFFGSSYFVLDVFYRLFLEVGGRFYIYFVVIYCAIFLIYPVFRLAQTIPLISSFFKHNPAQQVTANVLFYSTLGSFAGSIVTTLILMNVLGVNWTSGVILLALFTMYLLTHFNDVMWKTIVGLMAILTMIFINQIWLEASGVIMQTPYSTISVHQVDGGLSRLLSINRASSSKVSQLDEMNFSYMKFLEENFLKIEERPYSVLVLGAGGFVFGRNDQVNHFEYVDIEPHLKSISEKHFLYNKLGPNKHFTAMPAEVFVRQSKQKYHLILIDTFSSMIHVPVQLISREYFQAVKELLEPDGVLLINVITDPYLKDVFSQRLDNTLRSVFVHLNRQVIGKLKIANNIIYSYVNSSHDNGVYSNDLNTAGFDQIKLTRQFYQAIDAF